MGDVLLNGREPLDWELAAVERARQHERDQAAEQLAGVLASGRPQVPGPRPPADIGVEFARARRPATDVPLVLP